MKRSIFFAGVAAALSTVAPLTAQTLTPWASPVKVVASDGTITKSAGCEGCPDAGAHSATLLAANGYAEFTPAAGARLFAGLSADLSDATSSSTIDFAFSFWPDGGWEIRELGVYKADGMSAAGDRFRVSVEAGWVVYRRNGVIVYTSATPPSYPLTLDTTLYSLAAGISGATVVETSTVPTVVDPPPPTYDTAPTGPPVFTKIGPYEAVTDRLMHAKPALPVLGPAGSSVNDPVFGSRIVRVTDAATRPDSPDQSYKTPSSSHQNAWSARSTRFYVVGGGGAALPYSFDAATGTARRIAGGSSASGGLVLGFYIEPQFSYVRDSIIYGSVASGSLRTIDQYDFTSGVYTRLLDLDTLVPGLAGTYIGRIGSTAGPTERLLAMFGGDRQDAHNYAVVVDAAAPANRQLLDTKASTLNGAPTNVPLNFMLHSANIDRSGRYVMLYPTSADQTSARKAPQSVLWDTQTNVLTEVPASARPYGHDAFGYGVMVNQDCCTTTAYDAAQWQFRSLASLLETRDLIRTVLTPKEVYMADHGTWNNVRPDNSAPYISATYRYGLNITPLRAWDDEIFAIQTDAPAGVEPTVWRFAHHRSDVTNDIDAAATSFWYMPRPNISGDGRWVLFTSNWEKTLGTDPNGDTGGKARQDVFVVALKSSVASASPVVIGTTALAAGRVSVGYSSAVSASGGSGALTWSITGGALPAGLSLDSATGAITGTPGTAGTYGVTLTATDTTDPANAATAAFTIAIGAAPVRVTTTALAAGRATVPYSATLEAAGGGGAITWSVVGGALPAGLTLNATTGGIAGTPNTAGAYAVTVTATDSTDPTNAGTAASTITIAAAVKITSPRTLPSAAKRLAYSYVVLAANAIGTMKWDLAGGSMPPGLTLDAATGEISGICPTRGTWSFTARVKDSSTNDMLTLTLHVK